jgi:hypothetical protein
LTYACYGMFQSVNGLLLRNDPPDAVWRESEMAIDFAREAKFGDAVDIIRSQQTYRPTFADKYALVSAEIARLEGRDVDAMRLYDQAIVSARESGCVQSEGLAHEHAARFYGARGATTTGHAHLKAARGCYGRWGPG